MRAAGPAAGGTASSVRRVGEAGFSHSLLPPFNSAWIPGCEIVPPTHRVGLSSAASPFRKHLQRHSPMCVSSVF